VIPVLDDLAQLTPDEWLVVAVATILCVGGLLLPMAGNLLGQLFLGEDPAVRNWRQKWLARREQKRALRSTRKAEKRRRKAARKAKRLARKGGPTSETPA
jgi:hypothetical protein